MSVPDKSLLRLCTPKEVAERLACSQRTITRAMDRGEIVWKAVGRRRRIPEREVRRLLEEGLASRC